MKPFLAIFLLITTVVGIGRAEPVRIGILTDLSGDMASWGQQTRIGAQIAAEEITKAGGEVRLFFGDHQLQAKNAVSEFQKLTELNDVEGIYTEFTPTTVAIAPLAGAKELPVIYSAAATSPLNSSPYIFKSYLDYVQGCRMIGDHWRSHGVTAVGILKANMEFGELCELGLKEVYPGALEASYNPGDDVATPMLLLKSKGVSAVINTGFEPDLIRMLKSARNLNWTPFIATQSDAVARETLKLFPDLLEKMIVFALPPLPQTFTARVRDKDPTNTFVSISAAGLGYLHVKQFYSARLKCPGGDAKCMACEIAHASPDDVTGFERWDARKARFRLSLRSWRQGQEIESDSQ